MGYHVVCGHLCFRNTFGRGRHLWRRLGAHAFRTPGPRCAGVCQIAITIEGALSAEYSLQLPEGVGSLKDCDRLEVSLPEPLRAYLRDKNTLRAFERLLATGRLQSIEAESGRLSALFNKRTIAAEGLALRLQRLSEFGALLKNIPHTPELAKSPSGAPLGLRS